jgi:hypothetical protein
LTRPALKIAAMRAFAIAAILAIAATPALAREVERDILRDVRAKSERIEREAAKTAVKRTLSEASLDGAGAATQPPASSGGKSYATKPQDERAAPPRDVRGDAGGARPGGGASPRP